MKLINIAPQQHDKPVGRAPLRQRDPAELPRFTLDLAGSLQRHLDLEPLIDQFSRSVGEFVPHDSLSFRHELAGHERVIVHGSAGRHACSYQLTVEKMSLGTLRVTRRRRFDETELASLEQLLGAVVYPIRNALLYRRAQHDAATDPLTGLSNRGVFSEALPREISRAQRYDTQLTLLMVDLDNLKQINDRNGHSAGDKALQAVAQTMRACVRDSDHVFRYAGDEFAVLLIGSAGAAASEVAERLRKTVAEQAPKIGTARPTLSIGLATLRTNDTGPKLFERADTALYGAKQAGRNCVCSAD